jgi:hypothetical protein
MRQRLWFDACALCLEIAVRQGAIFAASRCRFGAGFEAVSIEVESPSSHQFDVGLLQLLAGGLHLRIG